MPVHACRRDLQTVVEVPGERVLIVMKQTVSFHYSNMEDGTSDTSTAAILWAVT